MTAISFVDCQDIDAAIDRFAALLDGLEADEGRRRRTAMIAEGQDPDFIDDCDAAATAWSAAHRAAIVSEARAALVAWLNRPRETD